MPARWRGSPRVTSIALRSGVTTRHTTVMTPFGLEQNDGTDFLLPCAVMPAPLLQKAREHVYQSINVSYHYKFAVRTDDHLGFFSRL